MSNLEQHMSLCNILNRVYERKNHDYGDSFSKTYKELGLISAVTQIMHKYNRLVALSKGATQQVREESIRDTLLDMANYCIMTVMEIDRESREVDKHGKGQEAEDRADS